QKKFAEALSGLVPDPSIYSAMVKPAQDQRFGDYQANCAMPLAKVLGGTPRDIASKLVERLDVGDYLEPAEIAGPGFINLRAWVRPGGAASFGRSPPRSGWASSRRNPPRPLSSTTARPTWPSPCMWAICGAP